MSKSNRELAKEAAERGTDGITNAYFAASAAYIAKVAAAWSGDSLVLPEHVSEIAPSETVGRFTASIREMLRFLDERAKVDKDAQPPEPTEDEIERLREAKDGAYRERNMLVALLARLYPSGIARTAIEGWDPEWNGCVYIDTPEGQLSWHYHDSEARLFADLPPYDSEWDGHTTEEKYARIGTLIGAADVVGGRGRAGGGGDLREHARRARDRMERRGRAPARLLSAHCPRRPDRREEQDMTISPETRAKLRRLHDEARAATDAYFSSGGDRLLAAIADDALALWQRAACRNLLPLLDALEAAEAERDRLREESEPLRADMRRLLKLLRERAHNSLLETGERIRAADYAKAITAALGEQP